jgi:hypothetical protein
MSDECQIVFELPRSKSTELDGTHSAAIALFCLEGRTPARRARTRPKFEIGQVSSPPRSAPHFKPGPQISHPPPPPAPPIRRRTRPGTAAPPVPQPRLRCCRTTSTTSSAPPAPPRPPRGSSSRRTPPFGRTTMYR